MLFNTLSVKDISAQCRQKGGIAAAFSVSTADLELPRQAHGSNSGKFAICY